MEKSKVILLPCETYGEENIYSLMKKGLELLGGLPRLIGKEEKILLKLFLLSAVLLTETTLWISLILVLNLKAE